MSGRILLEDDSGLVLIEVGVGYLLQEVYATEVAVTGLSMSAPPTPNAVVTVSGTVVELTGNLLTVQQGDSSTSTVPALWTEIPNSIPAVWVEINA